MTAAVVRSIPAEQTPIKEPKTNCVQICSGLPLVFADKTVAAIRARDFCGNFFLLYTAMPAAAATTATGGKARRRKPAARKPAKPKKSGGKKAKKAKK
jgi:hypothetical protein